MRSQAHYPELLDLTHAWLCAHDPHLVQSIEGSEHLPHSFPVHLFPQPPAGKAHLKALHADFMEYCKSLHCSVHVVHPS